MTGSSKYDSVNASFYTPNADEAMTLKEQAFDNENAFNNGKTFSSRAPWYYEMQELGYNYRITDMQCALGISQLKKLDDFIAKRKAIVEKYNAAFSGSPLLITPYQESDRESSWHLYMLRRSGQNREDQTGDL